MKAMIFAAGLGTRLKPFTASAPKALAKVGDKTLLECSIKYLQRFGIYDVIVNVHHFAEMITTAVTDANGFGSNVTLSNERDCLLDTGGGLKKVSSFFDKEACYVVMNVDVLTTLDVGKMITNHITGNAQATLAVIKRKSGRHLLFDNDMRLCGWKNNTTNEVKIVKDNSPLQEYAFTGIQILSNSIWRNQPFEGKFSIIDLYLHLAKTQLINGYDHTNDIFIDAGTPESLEKASGIFGV